MNKLISMIFALVISLPAFAQQNTLTATTLSAAAASTDRIIYVASATGIAAATLTTNATQLYVVASGNPKGEIMTVKSVSGTAITVTRNAGIVTGWPSGATVLIGYPNYFYNYDPNGACTTASVYVSPWINTTTGSQWLCSSVTGTWVPGFNNDTASPAPTAAVASAAGLITPSGPLFHVTGTAAITGFNVPVGFSGGTITVIPDGIFTTTNANNIALASTAVVSKPITFTYDPNTAKFYPSY